MQGIISRKCKICERIKPIHNFYPRKLKHGVCYRTTCKDCDSERSKIYHAKNKNEELSKFFLRQYGISLKDYDKMLDQQKGVCAICGEPETANNVNGEVKRLAIDHNHSTGKVRELLCSKCNGCLGLAGESIDGLLKFVSYLEKWNE